MEKELSKIFEDLVKLELNNNVDDYAGIYRDISSKIDINDYLDYDRGTRSGICHVILNIRVSEKSTFVPFISAMGSFNNKQAKPVVEALMKKHIIKYNYVEFVSDVVRKMNKGKDLPRISFSTHLDKNGEINLCETHRFKAKNPNNSWFKPSEDENYDFLNEDFKSIIPKEKWNDSFVKILSQTYYDELGLDTLYYTIICIDSSFNDFGRQTHIQIISSNQDEASYFLDKTLEKIREIASFIRTRFVHDLLQKNRFESIKSAISAIMSRNMSHNLGSHYLYYTKAHLETLAGRINCDISPDIRGAARALAYMQARMDYLATIISNDKYPYGPVNFKSQIYDELTIDDFSKRHFEMGLNDKGEEKSYNRITNFLLSNLILSEDFTRPNILDDRVKTNINLLKLQVKYQENPNEAYKLFTGTNRKNALGGAKAGIATISSEAAIKNAISTLNIALPGGTMSCHAFFNVVENFIRNSAKYSREDFERTAYNKVLTVTIAIRPDTEMLTQDGGYRFYDFIVYDNKRNATFFKKEGGISEGESSLYESMIKRLSGIKILDDDNSVEKENKGLKEMIFSAAWMRAYTFENNKTYADIITDIQNAEMGEDKLREIQDHCFELVAVEEKSDGALMIYRGEEVMNQASYLPVNLGVLIKLPLFRKFERIDSTLNRKELIAKSLEVYSDMVEVDALTDDISRIYTRVYVKSTDDVVSSVESFKSILRKRFKDFDKFHLVFGTNEESCPDDTKLDKFTIKFAHHLKDHVKDKGETLEDQARFAYADSVSGGNYTKTMNELFDAGLKNGLSDEEKEEAEYYRLQIKESALTRITLIDERLHKNMISHENGDIELALKNIRVMNYVETNSISRIMDLFAGNKFYDVNGYYNEKPDFSHFVSIHLGLIEKIIASKAFKSFAFSPIDKDEKDNKKEIIIYGVVKEREDGTRKWMTTDHNGNINEYSLDNNLKLSCGELGVEDCAKTFMYFLTKEMGGGQTHVTVHSGRGNYSKELEGPLDSFPFVSLSSIESAFNNSKMLLSQLFYNTRYVGKGVYNHKNKDYAKKNNNGNYNA